jgi:hypothetical protein
MRTRFEQGRGVRDERRGGVVLGEDVRIDEVKGGITGGDHAIFEERKSWLDGIAILRTTSKVVRHRMCKRAPLRHAVCVAVGEGTDSVVAGANQYLLRTTLCFSGAHFSCWDISIFSIASGMERSSSVALR